MTTRLSSKGQVVLPGPLRRSLGLQAGEVLEVSLEGERVVLTRVQARPPKVRIKVDRLTGLPVLSAGKGVAPLTGEQVSELMSEFP